MRLTDARQLADELMDKWLDDKWTFEWSNATRWLGQCNIIYRNTKWEKRVITLSKKWTQVGSVNDVTDTILHEIAHGLDDLKSGHGNSWKRWCLVVGAKPQRCALPDIVLQKKFLVHCEKCDMSYGQRQNSPSRLRHHHCIVCGPEGRIGWKQNPEYRNQLIEISS